MYKNATPVPLLLPFNPRTSAIKIHFNIDIYLTIFLGPLGPFSESYTHIWVIPFLTVRFVESSFTWLVCTNCSSKPIIQRTFKMTIVDVKMERERVESGTGSLSQPNFLSCPSHVAITNPTYWNNVILSQISQLTFVVKSLSDNYHFSQLLSCEALPNLNTAITSVSQEGMYYFAGIGNNRVSNPYIDEVKRLPNLRALSLGFHTASLTETVWTESQATELQRNEDTEHLKERRVRHVQQIVDFYKLDDILELPALQVLNLECIDSEQVEHWTRGRRPIEAMNDIKRYFDNGFYVIGRRVQVNIFVTRVPWT